MWFIYLLAIFIAIRLLAIVGWVWDIIPANTGGILVSRRKSSSIGTSGGGVSDLLHEVPGKYIDKSNHDEMNWKYKKGKEKKNLFHYIPGMRGVRYIGIFMMLRTNEIRTYRQTMLKSSGGGLDENKPQYEIQEKVDRTRYAFFSGQHDIMIKEAETAGVFGIDLTTNILFEERCPVRVRLKLADSYAQLTLMVKNRSIEFTGDKLPEDLIGGKADVKEAYERYIMDNSFRKAVLLETGIWIRGVRLFDIDISSEDRELFQKRAIAKIEKDAAIIKAQGDARVTKLTGMARNDVDADYVKRVTLKVAADPGAVTVHGQDAYRENEHVTVYGPGQGGLNVLVTPPSAPPKAPTP